MNETETLFISNELNNSLLEPNQADIHTDTIAIVGGSQVGKTSLAIKFLLDYFPSAIANNDLLEKNYKIIRYKKFERFNPIASYSFNRINIF